MNKKQVFTAKNGSVYLNNQFFLTVKIMQVDEARLDGESWLAMRERTEPLRLKEQEIANSRAVIIANALNNEGV